MKPISIARSSKASAQSETENRGPRPWISIKIKSKLIPPNGGINFLKGLEVNFSQEESRSFPQEKVNYIKDYHLDRYLALFSQDWQNREKKALISVKNNSWNYKSLYYRVISGGVLLPSPVTQ